MRDEDRQRLPLSGLIPHPPSLIPGTSRPTFALSDENDSKEVSMNTRRLMITAAAALLLIGSGRLLAQPSSTPDATPPAPPRRGFSFHRRPRAAVGSPAPITGGIVGNKRTHVYHLAGDTGNMPAPQNRVYFRSEAEALAAHYHAAKKRGVGHTTTHRRLPGIRRTRTMTPSGQQPVTTPTTPTPNQ